MNQQAVKWNLIFFLKCHLIFSKEWKCQLWGFPRISGITHCYQELLIVSRSGWKNIECVPSCSIDKSTWGFKPVVLLLDFVKPRHFAKVWVLAFVMPGHFASVDVLVGWGVGAEGGATTAPAWTTVRRPTSCCNVFCCCCCRCCFRQAWRVQ